MEATVCVGGRPSSVNANGRDDTSNAEDEEDDDEDELEEDDEDEKEDDNVRCFSLFQWQAFCSLKCLL